MLLHNATRNCHQLSCSEFVMKHPTERDENSRFQGSLRHYHRTDTRGTRSWDEWVDGKVEKSRPASYWIKLTATVLAVLALFGVIVGLFIELR
jgi:hypothetical protein